MDKAYWTLAIRWPTRLGGAGSWTPEFGSYDRADVTGELESYLDGGDLRRAEMRIVRSGDRQADIDAAVAALNAEPVFVTRPGARVVNAAGFTAGAAGIVLQTSAVGLALVAALLMLFALWNALAGASR